MPSRPSHNRPSHRITLQAGRLFAEIDPDRGSAVTDLSILDPFNDRAPILRRSPATAAAPFQTGCYLLAPWSNRIANARFHFGGREHELRPNFPDGSAIHGDTASRPWRITDRSPVHVRTMFDSRDHARVNFPFAFGAVFRAELSPDALALELGVTNLGTRAMPAGCGFHPFFMRSLFAHGEDPLVRAPVAGRYPADGCIPTGSSADDAACAQLRELAPISRSTGLDDCFAGFEGRAEMVYPDSGVRVTLDASPELSHLVVFTPRLPNTASGATTNWFCLEPVTHANDAFNLESRGVCSAQDAGVRVLEPGESLNTSLRITIADA